MSDDAPVDPRKLAQIRELADADEPDFHLRLIRKFISETRDAVARMGEAASTGDCRPVREAAHKLIGSAGELGADALAGAAQKVRLAAREGRVDTDGVAAARAELERVVAALEAEFEL